MWTAQKGFLGPPRSIRSRCRPGSTEADIDVFAAEYQRTGFRGGLNWYRNIDRNWELTAPWHGAIIRQPALFIAGTRDAVITGSLGQRALDDLESVVPNLAQKILLDGAGHWIQQERPDEVNAALIEFARAHTWTVLCGRREFKTLAFPSPSRRPTCPSPTTPDNVRLHYEEAGSGTPLLFVHEFAGDHRAWEPQMRYFARRYRCITYSARGYTPSDVPPTPDSYGYERFRDDVIVMLDHLKIDKAHIVGLSMGGYATLCAGIKYPQRALSLTLAGTGSGSERAYQEEFRAAAEVTAKEYDTLGSAGVAKTYGMGPARIPFEVKDPRGYKEFYDQFASHDAKGAANTLRGYQIRRPSVYDFEAEVKKITLPTLIVCGDEDDPCIEPSVWLKQHIATSGLAMFPKSGHTVNIEEPALFNQTLGDFLALVDAGRWGARDKRSMRAERK